MDNKVILIAVAVIAVAVIGIAALGMNFNSESDNTDGIRYYGNGGEYDGKDYIDSTNTSVLTNLFKYEGKTWTSWNTAKDGSGTTYKVGDTGSKGLKLYAQWKDILPTMNVTSIGGNATDKVLYMENGSPKTLNMSYNLFDMYKDDCFEIIPAKEGMKLIPTDKGFVGNITIDGTEYSMVVAVTLKDSTGKEVKATYTEYKDYGFVQFDTGSDLEANVTAHSYSGYTLATYNANNNDAGITVRNSGLTYNIAKDSDGNMQYSAMSPKAASFFQWEGHKVASWNTAKDGSGTSYSPEEKVPTGTTVYAQWTTA